MYSNATTAQVSTKKKTTTTAVKKTPLALTKSAAKPAKTAVAKTAPVAVPLTPTVPSGRNTCKVTTTKAGCSIVFEFNLDPNSEQAKKGDTYTKREFLVSYLDNSVTEVGKKDVIEGAVKVIKSEAAVMADEVSNASGQQVNVTIKDLMFVFDVIKDKKQLWSLTHDIKIHGHDVEIYAQDMNDGFTKDQGVFSLTDNNWIAEPVNQEINLDNPHILKKVQEYIEKIDSLIASNAEEESFQKLKDKFKDMRSSDIKKHGEFSHGNLIFKELRNLGYLDKMNNYIKTKQDERLSLG
jgi:hypothetical protein